MYLRVMSDRFLSDRKYDRIEVNGITPEEYWCFFERSYSSRGRIISCKREKFLNLINAAIAHDACEIRDVREHGELVAANVILRDGQRAYCQFLTHFPGKGDDAQTMITLDAIEKTLGRNMVFDFEGSMISGVCEFYVSWNPELELNYLITKYSKRYRIFRFLKDCIAKGRPG